MSKFVPNEREFAALTAPGGLVDRATSKAAGKVRDDARMFTPVKTGRLRQSIMSSRQASTRRSVTWRIGTRIGDVAHYQHDGTGIYGPKGTRIYPRRAKVLRWPAKGVRGGFAYAASVAGVKGKHFLTKALDMLKASDFS